MKPIVALRRKTSLRSFMLPVFVCGLMQAVPSFAQDQTIVLGAAVQLTGTLANVGRYYQDA